MDKRDKNVKQPKKDKVLKPYEIEEREIQTLNEIDLSGTYSYASYLRWKFEERVELIRGKIFQMGAPWADHQRLLGFIHAEIYNHLRNHSCEVFAAPFDVRFPDHSKSNDQVYTVLQPDICVICDERKLDKRGCIGAPDIIIEILSPGNNRKELKNKFDIYEQYGVREYWIVSPSAHSLLKYVLNETGVFVTGKSYAGGTEFVSDILPGFCLNIDEVFGVMKASV